VVQPEPQAHSVDVLPPQQLAAAFHVEEQRQPVAQAARRRRGAMLDGRHEFHESSRARHVERGLTFVDARAQPGIGAPLEQPQRAERMPLGHRHVQRRVVVDAALVPIGAKR
jgi:hypothetical protein